MTRAADIRLWIGRRRWDLVRFGITPRGIYSRIRRQAAPRIVSTSIPKAGTHLLERTLCLHPNLHRLMERKTFSNDPGDMDQMLERTRPGQLVCGHLAYSEGMSEVVHAHRATLIFVVRDPRDIVVSHAHYIKDFEGHEYHHLTARYSDLKSRVRLFIEGDEEAGIESIATVLERYAGWLDAADIVVRYEDLVGETTRKEATRELFDQLGLPLKPHQLEKLTASIVSPVSVTFRKGRSGEGCRIFDDELERLFLQSAGPYLEAYGYPVKSGAEQ